MTKTAEQLDAEADALLATITTELTTVFTGMRDRVTAFANEIEASDIPQTFKTALGRKIMTGVEKALDAAVGDEPG